MRDRTMALVPIHDGSCCLPGTYDRKPALGLGLGAVSLASLAALAIAMPSSGLWLIGSIAAALTVIGWNVRSPAGAMAIHPGEIESPELAASYRALLASHAELARVVAADGAVPAMSRLLDRSRDTVVLCGRLALLASRSQRYALLHPAEQAAADAAAFRRRAADAADPETQHLLASAAVSADRRAAVASELRRSHDRTCAELEAATAALDALIAALVARRLADDRALALAADSITARVDELEADAEARAA